jgi:hypothetical protein
MSTPVSIKIKVDIDMMMEFHAGIPKIGTLGKPYSGDDFYLIEAPSELLVGPQKNILLLRDNAVYTWNICSLDGTPLSLTTNGVEHSMAFTLKDNDGATTIPGKEKWGLVFNNDSGSHSVDEKGKLIVKNKAGAPNAFSMQTKTKVNRANNMKYSINFSFEKKGEVFYGFIDPTVKTVPPPPPPPDGDE